MKKIALFLLLGLGFLGTISQANNLKIDNLTIVDDSHLRFLISWENSWRVDPSSPPGNYDAVWIFIKRAYCSEPITWYHCNVSSTVSDHQVGSPLMVHMDTYNNAGLFIQRATNGYGMVNSVECIIALSGVPAGDYNFKVFGIEMVYIPQGQFYMGDGATTYRWGQYNLGAYTPYLVDNNVINMGNGPSNTNLANNSPLNCYSATYQLNPNYPKGYNSFYCMKYEVSQGMIADFFNHTPNQVWTNFNGLFKDSGGNFAPGVVNSSYSWQNVVFQYPWRAISTPDSYNAAPVTVAGVFFAYFDWVGLRPMTELEYEKACRGPATVVQYEYAWGQPGLVRFYPPSDPDKTNYQTNSESHSKTLTPVQGVAVLPSSGAGGGTEGELYRVGFAAKESTNRISAGASYYGVLDMTGNASEWCIQLYFSNYANLSYSNVGDGSLPVSGYNDTPNWTNSAVNLQRSIIPRGGSWSTSWGPTYDGYITVSGINNTSDNGDLVRSHGLHMRGVR